MSDTHLAELEADLAALAPESQLRVNMVRDIIRDLMSHDSASEESVFAMLLVMEETDADDAACELALAEGEARQ
jgi:hemerythrin superfamily protein